MPARSDAEHRDAILEAVDGLTRPIQLTRQRPVTDHDGDGQPVRLRHVTERITLPCLLAQLADPAALSVREERHGSSTPSTPMPLDALDCRIGIERETAQWLAWLGTLARGNLAADLRALAGSASSLEGETLAALARAARSWLLRARTCAGWAEPAWRPHSTCPVCDEVGTLRVLLDQGGTAHCTGCWSTWDRATIGVLAAHVALGIERQRGLKNLAEAVPIDLTT